MELFNLLKKDIKEVKKVSYDVSNCDYIVLGACCKKSADTFKNVQQAVAELGFHDEVVNIGDAVEIARYGVMQTPALVVNGKVLSCGRLIGVDEAKKFIEKEVPKNG